jgi:hypothetical protein
LNSFDDDIDDVATTPDINTILKRIIKVLDI